MSRVSLKNNTNFGSLSIYSQIPSRNILSAINIGLIRHHPRDHMACFICLYLMLTVVHLGSSPASGAFCPGWHLPWCKGGGRVSLWGRKWVMTGTISRIRTNIEGLLSTTIQAPGGHCVQGYALASYTPPTSTGVYRHFYWSVEIYINRPLFVT